jgi:L-asparaginase
MASNLVFLACGGTFEKVYLPQSGQLGFDQSRLSDWLNTCRIAQSWRTETLMLIDSLDMAQEHRLKIAHHIQGLPETKLIVVHGTDTMVETAKTIMQHRRADQTVVLTGAMIPAALENSDAIFNLGLATAAAQTKTPGVYIAMSGQVWPADRVQKNKALGVFESI